MSAADVLRLGAGRKLGSKLSEAELTQRKEARAKRAQEREKIRLKNRVRGPSVGTNARWGPFGKRNLIRRMKIGDYAKLDCGCLVKLVPPDTHFYTLRPLAIMDNSECNVIATKEQARVVYGDCTVQMYGCWKSATEGYKLHRYGFPMMDAGTKEGIRVDPEVMKAKWRKEQ